jgi:hypothetical protein
MKTTGLWTGQREHAETDCAARNRRKRPPHDRGLPRCWGAADRVVRSSVSLATGPSGRPEADTILLLFDPAGGSSAPTASLHHRRAQMLSRLAALLRPPRQLAGARPLQYRARRHAGALGGEPLSLMRHSSVSTRRLPQAPQLRRAAVPVRGCPVPSDPPVSSGSQRHSFRRMSSGAADAPCAVSFAIAGAGSLD